MLPSAVLIVNSHPQRNRLLLPACLPCCGFLGVPQQQQGAKSLSDNSISVRGREQDLAILEKAAVAATSRLDDGVSVTVDKVRTVPDSW